MKQIDFDKQIISESQKQSESFNARLVTTRKLKRKVTKRIHNCCILIKNADGSTKIEVRQFLHTDHFKTKKFNSKKAQQLSVFSDGAVAKEMKADLDKLSIQKEDTKAKTIKQKVSTSHSLSLQEQENALEAVIPVFQYPLLFYFLQANDHFQLI